MSTLSEAIAANAQCLWRGGNREC